jgi:histone H3/H4
MPAAVKLTSLSPKKAPEPKKAAVTKKVVEVKKEPKKRRAVKNAYVDVQFNTYIYKLLHSLSDGTGLNGESLSTFNNLIKITISKIMENVNKIMSRGTRATISPKEVESALMLTLPEQLASTAIAAGQEAVTSYISHKSEKGKAEQRSVRAGLILPVPRIENMMMEIAVAKRKSATAAVYLAAAVQKLMSEVIQMAAKHAAEGKRRRITPRCISMVINTNDEFKTFYGNVLLSGGVVPHIPAELLSKPVPKKRARKVKQAPSVKKPTSAFMYFSKAKRPDVVAKNPEMKFADIGRELGKMWKAASTAEKAPFEKEANKDRERYNKEVGK